MTEYLYASYNSPTKKFTEFECLNQNPGYQRGTMRLEDQIFFYGELVPPFIDVLGRGANFRPSKDDQLKYHSYPAASQQSFEGQCYRNLQKYGSAVYQRFKDYFGAYLGVPRCCGAFTPSTRVVSRRGCRGWFLFRI